MPIIILEKKEGGPSLLHKRALMDIIILGLRILNLDLRRISVLQVLDTYISSEVAIANVSLEMCYYISPFLLTNKKPGKSCSSIILLYIS